MAALAVLLLLTTSTAVASLLRVRPLAEFLLAAYVIAFAEVVALVLLLSPFDAVRRIYLLAALVLVSTIAVSLWLWAGRPRPVAAGLRQVPKLFENGFVAVLAVALVFAMAYVAGLVIWTAPNNWDSLTYHLARAAFWRQGGGVEYIGNTYDERLNANPPNAEIALTFVLELTRDERLTGFVQFGAAIACATAVFALASRLGLSRAESAFGALLFLSLPIVVLQASTTQNDLVVASLLLCAVVFLLGGSRRTFTLGSIALALAVGTKVTAVYALPVLFAIAAFAAPRAARLPRMGAISVGALLGAYWFFVNLIETGRPLGRRPDAELLTLFRPHESALAAFARAIDTFDLSGARDADIIIFIGVAVGVTAVFGISRQWDEARSAALVIASPILLVPLSYGAWQLFVKLHEVSDTPERSLPLDGWDAPTAASESYSWFGPVAVLLVIWAGAAAVARVRDRRLPPVTVVLAAAPIAWFLLLGVSLGYDPWQGRFFIFPVALSASLWGLVLDARGRAVGIATLATVMAFLSLVNFVEKPSGLRLLNPEARKSAWSMERWEVQSVVRRDLRPVLRFLDERVPNTDSVALALGGDDFGYPAFGANVGRSVELVPPTSDGSGVEADWLVANRRRARRIDRSCWEPVLGGRRGWRVFRAARTRCPIS